MKFEFEIPKPTYPSSTAQDLEIGQILRYEAGNGVIRVAESVYFEFDTWGNAVRVSSSGATLAHGRGQLLPKATKVILTLL